MSSPILVKGRLFNNNSISDNVAYHTSSVNKRSFMADLSTRLTDFTSASQTLPVQDDEGGLNFHFISD